MDFPDTPDEFFRRMAEAQARGADPIRQVTDVLAWIIRSMEEPLLGAGYSPEEAERIRDVLLRPIMVTTLREVGEMVRTAMEGRSGDE